jgi:O-antigen biosynthesis protein
MKTLLIIGYVWPEPRSSAAGSRMLQLIQAFQQDGFRVVFGSPADSSPHALDLATIAVEAVSLTLNCSGFDDFVRTLNPDVVMFDRFMMEEQFGWRVEACCPQALRILDSEDLHCLRHARHAALKAALAAGSTVLPIEPAISFVYSELAMREIAAILRCDLTLTISEFEMQWLQQTFQVPPSQLLYCPFMQDFERDAAPNVGATQALPGFAERQHFVSIGNFRHEPNWDAVRYLKESVWPLIRARLPGVELHVYGAYPPKKATDLHNRRDGFLVKGWANDALQVVRQARVLLAPLRFGAGLKGKLIDAALCGTPAVTTSIGAEGMYGVGAEDLYGFDGNNAEGSGIECRGAGKAAALVADEADYFAGVAVNLYQNASLWQLLSANGEQLINQRFNRADHAPRLQQTIRQLLDDVDGHRLQHFYGAMLRHHSLKSTRYMAQWIEAKNALSSRMKHS